MPKKGHTEEQIREGGGVTSSLLLPAARLALNRPYELPLAATTLVLARGKGLAGFEHRGQLAHAAPVIPRLRGLGSGFERHGSPEMRN